MTTSSCLLCFSLGNNSQIAMKIIRNINQVCHVPDILNYIDSKNDHQKHQFSGDEIIKQFKIIATKKFTGDVTAIHIHM